MLYGEQLFSDTAEHLFNVTVVLRGLNIESTHIRLRSGRGSALHIDL
jgi:hypothetical protein